MKRRFNKLNNSKNKEAAFRKWLPQPLSAKQGAKKLHKFK